MKSFGSTTRTAVALSAAAMSVACAFFLPYGYPWPTVAWAIVACAAAVSVAQRSGGPSPSMSDVISGVEGESARTSGARGPRVASTRTVL